jgi:hypothetical protein
LRIALLGSPRQFVPETILFNNAHRRRDPVFATGLVMLLLAMLLRRGRCSGPASSSRAVLAGGGASIGAGPALPDDPAAAAPGRQLSS